jgi:uncharacterized protein
MHNTLTTIFTKQLGALKNILEAAKTYAEEKKIDPSVLLNDRIAPDMFPFVRQVQIACDNAKSAMARLAGIENPKHEDIETTIAELHDRIEKTLAFVHSVPQSAFTEAATRRITLPYFPNLSMSGEEYVTQYAIPNFLFHVTIAYAIMRHQGVPIGKKDFMNGLPLV